MAERQILSEQQQQEQLASSPDGGSVAAIVSPIVTTINDEPESIDCSPCCDNSNIRRVFKAVLLGQVLSVCLCGTAVSSQLLSERGVNSPAAQSFLNYFLLCFSYGAVLICRKGENSLFPVLRERGWKYFLISLVDVEANYMVIYAYQFTNLTSIQLLDCSTIPMVLFLSWLFLSVRYLLTHIIGVFICLIGIAVLIWADVLDGKGQSGGNSRVIGDILCLSSSFLYAMGNVGEEYFVKQNNRIEYLGLVGIFGSILSGIQLALFERNELAKVKWSGVVISSYLLFAVSMFLFYSLVSVVMQRSSALMFNLSVLSSDFYSLIFGLFLFKIKFHALYFVSFLVVTLGSIVYALRETKVRDPDEPRKLCPCCFMCCCCSDCCFEQDEITENNSANVLSLHARSDTAQYCPIHGLIT
uniref:Solute carrier family 35 member F1 n=1 Tax=Syphacia muris TaxID=451379 RepID=A0A0N5AYZ3_9BILA